MAFTAADVKKLREMTNVGMMDCKKALTETDGDMDKAVEWLREKGLAKAAKKAGRIAAEGMAYATVCEKCGVGAMVEVNCETDFCAKSAPFVQFVKDICQVVLQDNPADVEAIKECKYPGTDLKVSEVLPEKVMSIGENLQIRRFHRFDKNTSVSYVHAGGKIGVLVNLEVEGGIDATTIGKDIAMQIAALNPRFWDKSLVTDDVLAEEKKILVAQMDNDPKMASSRSRSRKRLQPARSTSSTKRTACSSSRSSRTVLSPSSSTWLPPRRSLAARSSSSTLSALKRAKASKRSRKISLQKSLRR